jgi:hypothetical protein
MLGVRTMEGLGIPGSGSPESKHTRAPHLRLWNLVRAMSLGWVVDAGCSTIALHMLMRLFP